MSISASQATAETGTIQFVEASIHGLFCVSHRVSRRKFTRMLEDVYRGCDILWPLAIPVLPPSGAGWFIGTNAPRFRDVFTSAQMMKGFNFITYAPWIDTGETCWKEYVLHNFPQQRVRFFGVQATSLSHGFTCGWNNDLRPLHEGTAPAIEGGRDVQDRLLFAVDTVTKASRFRSQFGPRMNDGSGRSSGDRWSGACGSTGLTPVLLR